jgi:ATP-dependent DNA helicase RecG
MRPDELKTLIRSGEADRVEITRAAQDNEKFREAICAFSNDMAGRGLPSHLIIGIDEKAPITACQ